METTRSFFYDNIAGETAQNQKFIDYLRQHTSSGKTSFVVAGKPVCKTCWRLVCGLRYNKLSGLIQKMQRGVVTVQHGRLGIIQPSESTIRMTSWLNAFIGKIGDRMPSSRDIHLPSCLSKLDIYHLASDDLGRDNTISESSFYNLWTEKFSHVKIPKVCRSINWYLKLCVHNYGRRADFQNVMFVLIAVKRENALLI